MSTFVSGTYLSQWMIAHHRHSSALLSKHLIMIELTRLVREANVSRSTYQNPYYYTVNKYAMEGMEDMYIAMVIRNSTRKTHTIY